MADLNVNASPAGGASASPSGTGASSSGTIQPSGEAGQGATGSESFLPNGVDINTLPPALRAELDRINKEMVRGFTAKTQELADKSKQYADYDSFKEKAQFYDQFLKEEDAVKWWNDYVQKRNNPAGNPGDPNTELAAKLKDIEAKITVSEANEAIAAFSEAVDDKGERLHPDFDKLRSFKLGTHAQSGDYDLLRTAVELAPGATSLEKLENGYKSAKAFYDQIFEEGRKAGMGRINAKVRNSTEAPTLSTDKSVFTGDPKSLSAREARELAEKRVVVR